MVAELRFDEVNAFLLAALPELVPAYEEELHHWRGEPARPPYSR